jgi:hypothetical protein
MGAIDTAIVRSVGCGGVGRTADFLSSSGTILESSARTMTPAE